MKSGEPTKEDFERLMEEMLKGSGKPKFIRYSERWLRAVKRSKKLQKILEG